MFYEQELITFDILDVIELRQEQVNLFNSGRNFNALSFRLHADTVLKTETNEYRMRDNYLSYVPARLDYTRQSRIEELIAVHFNTTNYTTRSIEYFMPQRPEVLQKLFYKILDCWNKKAPGYKYVCSSVLYEIFAECYAQNYVRKSRDSKIRDSVDYILQNYKRSDISIKEIAERSFMSEVYFRKLFKEEYGVTPQKYIIDLRIQNAVGMISTGYYSLKDVAYMSGYNDYKYFSVEFKKNVGVSPSEYLYTKDVF